MITKKKIWIPIAIAGILLLLSAMGFAYFASDPWGFSREVSLEEAALRMQVVETAESYLGCKESDGSHQKIVDLYNSHQPLAQDYVVQYTDSWCAAFVSPVAIECSLNEIIPTECGCERQIGLFSGLQCWQEDDAYFPLPGDIIFYAWEEKLEFGDCTGWADHVGIVAEVYGPIIKVIEGNQKDSVTYHYVWIGHPQIRGYGLPNYRKAGNCGITPE